jgi:hypothetical protein
VEARSVGPLWNERSGESDVPHNPQAFGNDVGMGTSLRTRAWNRRDGRASVQRLGAARPLHGPSGPGVLDVDPGSERLGWARASHGFVFGRTPAASGSMVVSPGSACGLVPHGQSRESESGVSAEVLRVLWLRRKAKASGGRPPQMTPRLASQPSRARGGPASGAGPSALFSLAKSAWWWPALLGQVILSLTGDGNGPVPG